MRELDVQAQELFERMQKLSKAHIARAKRSVQEGREPDEEYLVKARRAYKELMELDEEKIQLADHMHSDICRHYEHCSSELRKFEEELKEKGQLKTPQMKTQQMARQDSSANLDAAGAGAGGASSSAMDVDAPAAVGAGGRRGRQSGGSAGDAGGNSHKRGRGRKVSFKEAERQREQAAAAAAAASSPLAGDAGSSGAGAAGASAAAFQYADAQLPISSREESNAPLCGAVPAADDYIIPENSKVCAKPPSTKMQPQDWILGTVLKFVPASNKYIILDEDESDADPWAAPQEPSQRQHTVAARMVIALPKMEPFMYTPYNEFPRGMWVLALYPDTTCFYKALVHTPPSETGPDAPRDYIVEFEDESEASGKGEPMRVPQKYVLRLP